MKPQSRDEMLEMVAMMRKYGGSFIHTLAECFIRADSDNLQRLYAAFPEIVGEYSKWAQRRRSRISHDR